MTNYDFYSRVQADAAFRSTAITETTAEVKVAKSIFVIMGIATVCWVALGFIAHRSIGEIANVVVPFAFSVWGFTRVSAKLAAIRVIDEMAEKREV